MKNPFKNESFRRLALLTLFHALFLILCSVIFWAGLYAAAFTGSELIGYICMWVLFIAVPFLIGMIMAKNGKWWWLFIIPFEILFFGGILYLYFHILVEDPGFKMFDGQTMILLLVPLAGQAAGIIARLLHLKRE